MLAHQEFLILKIAKKPIVKLDLSLKPYLVFHYIPLDIERKLSRTYFLGFCNLKLMKAHAKPCNDTIY